MLARKDGKFVSDADLDALDVVRGMFTLGEEDGTTASGIRGKAYEQFLDDDNELSLFEDLTPEECRDVAAEFRAHAERLPATKLNGEHEWTSGDLENAARWFEICAEKGYATHAWF